jgi:N6-adenosine-specific RNA methylase IME4
MALVSQLPPPFNDDGEQKFAPCRHCTRMLGPLKKATLRLHERDCLRNPTRRTWRCEACDRTFPHGSGFYKHNLSVAHLGDTRDAPKACLPAPPRKRARAAPPPSAVVVSETAPQLSRTALALPRCTDSFSAADHPMLHGVPSDSFAVIMADPPFRYQRRVGSGVAENHYATMSDDELRALPVGKIAADTAILLLWCSGPTMARAAALCEAWGFAYKTVAFVWVKTNKRAEPQSMGLGHYTRPGTEFVLVATKGRGATLIAERPDQVFAAPRTGHSEKPREMRSIVDAMTGRDRKLRKLELFSREAPDTTWSVWGDQVPAPLDSEDSEDSEASEASEASGASDALGALAAYGDDVLV